MKELVVATRNRGKLGEIQAFLKGLVDKVSCSSDFKNFPETIEDGVTFKQNALKKAREAMHFTGLPSLADDSGLIVDILDGRPGVYSARFAGQDADDSANNRKLLIELKDVPLEQRQASFVCSMAFVTPDGHEQTFTGRVRGVILTEALGESGFGYDPLFLVDGLELTMAQLTIEKKNQISHRGQVLQQFRDYLENNR